MMKGGNSSINMKGNVNGQINSLKSMIRNSQEPLKMSSFFFELVQQPFNLHTSHRRQYLSILSW